MNDRSEKVIVAQMQMRDRRAWSPARKSKRISKRLLRRTGIFAVVSLCMGGCVYMVLSKPEQVQSVMSHLTADFEYDDTLGRLQFVSSILPESAMVFLNSDDYLTEMILPTSAQQTHAWTQEEPWIEYACVGEIAACDAGEIVTVVKNRQDEYTVRVLHDHGYESVYSGLHAIQVEEGTHVQAGQQLGTAAGVAAFELRKEGLSILPTFSSDVR